MAESALQPVTSAAPVARAQAARRGTPGPRLVHTGATLALQLGPRDWWDVAVFGALLSEGAQRLRANDGAGAIAAYYARSPSMRATTWPRMSIQIGPRTGASNSARSGCMRWVPWRRSIRRADSMPSRRWSCAGSCAPTPTARSASAP
jgi:hypothetical protein